MATKVLFWACFFIAIVILFLAIICFLHIHGYMFAAGFLTCGMFFIPLVQFEIMKMIA